MYDKCFLAELTFESFVFFLYLGMFAQIRRCMECFVTLQTNKVFLTVVSFFMPEKLAFMNDRFCANRTFKAKWILA